MGKLLVLLTLSLAAVWAQSSQTIFYRAILSSDNEVPAVSTKAAGAATVMIHVVLDDAGNPVSGSVDALVSYKFPGPATLTAMHIHKGAAGVAGPVVLPFAIARTQSDSGSGTLPWIQSQFPSNSISLDTILGIYNDPSQFYFNVHTTDAPGGAIRGQLRPADSFLRLGIMSPANEVPAITDQSFSALSSVAVIMTRDASGSPDSALVLFDLFYQGFTDDTVLTGYHIHLGDAGKNGPVTINTGLPRTPVAAGGSGRLHFEVEADTTNPAARTTLDALQNNPAATYINVHTAVYGGGAARSPMLSVDTANLQMLMSGANEVPAVTTDGKAPAAVTVASVRNPDGSIAAGAVIFDVNPRFPAGTVFTAMHIHEGAGDKAGPVRIDSGLNNQPQLVADGTGNLFRIGLVTTPEGLAAMNGLVQNPEQFYLNLHTRDLPGGAVRAQLAPVVTDSPAITFVGSAAGDPTSITLAPGEIAVASGTALSKMPGTLDGFNPLASYPLFLNGTSVTVDGVAAPLYSVSPDTVFFQVPYEVANGSRPVVIASANGPSSAYSVNIVDAAPAIFVDGNGIAEVYRLGDGAKITPDNPAAAGDTLSIVFTGAGRTDPNVPDGAVAAAGDKTQPLASIALNVNGTAVPNVVYSTVPGFAGLFTATATLPRVAGPGTLKVQLVTADQQSNTGLIPVR